MAALVNTPENRIGAEVYMGGPLAKKHFERLEARRAEIEKEFGHALDWRELPQKEASRILLMRDDSSIKDRASWAVQHQWLAEALEKFDKVFRPRIQALPSSYDDQDEEA